MARTMSPQLLWVRISCIVTYDSAADTERL
jgi:hypothetical protein